MVLPDERYTALLRVVDTRDAGPGFPDMLAVPVRWDRLGELGLARVSERELVELRVLRDGVAGILFGVGDLTVGSDALNALVRRYSLMPQLDGGGAIRHVSGRTGQVAELAAVVLPQAMELLRSGDLERLAVCSSDDCAAPFVSSRRGATRSFCSPRCAGRERVRRFRDPAR